MIGRLNHIAIAVPDLAKASELYRTVMGAKVSAPKAQPAHGVTVVFVELPNTKIELLHPLGEKSPIANFLTRNADGGIHHVCYEVEDIYAARDKLKDPGKGEERGAPERPDLIRKAIITSIVAAVLWIAFYFLHQSDIFSFRQMVE